MYVHKLKIYLIAFGILMMFLRALVIPIVVALVLMFLQEILLDLKNPYLCSKRLVLIEMWFSPLLIQFSLSFILSSSLTVVHKDSWVDFPFCMKDVYQNFFNAKGCRNAFVYSLASNRLQSLQSQSAITGRLTLGHRKNFQLKFFPSSLKCCYVSLLLFRKNSKWTVGIGSPRLKCLLHCKRCSWLQAFIEKVFACSIDQYSVNKNTLDRIDHWFDANQDNWGKTLQSLKS